jgi:hypothetical protein
MTDLVIGFAALAVTATTTGLWFVAIRRVRIPENRSVFVAAWGLGAALGGVALMGVPGWLGGLAACVATIVSLFLLLTLAISPQRVGEDVMRVGGMMPAFSAIDADDQLFDSTQLAGNPALIKFFRGHW